MERCASLDGVSNQPQRRFSQGDRIIAISNSPNEDARTRWFLLKLLGGLIVFSTLAVRGCGALIRASSNKPQAAAPVFRPSPTDEELDRAQRRLDEMGVQRQADGTLVIPVYRQRATSSH
jgi:hypothetical protein